MSLVVSHDFGFFSCCSVKLRSIVDYINQNRKLPENVDSSGLFSIYKPNGIDDITYDFFQIPTNSDYVYKHNLEYGDWHQLHKYYTLDFENLQPILKLYFEPSQRIQTVSRDFLLRYGISYERCIGLYYRGTDKCSETKIDSFESFYTKLNELLENIHLENVQILLQTDTTQLEEYITSKMKHDTKHSCKLVIIKELLSSSTIAGIHNERTRQQNYNDITNLLSIVTILSKCKYILCTSGNVSCWIMLYRGNTKNVYQNLNCNWV